MWAAKPFAVTGVAVLMGAGGPAPAIASARFAHINFSLFKFAWSSLPTMM
jgi:hypothetical protein